MNGKPRFVTRQIGSDSIIVPISAGVGELDAIYTLNDVGSRIWQLIDGPTSIGRIVAAIRDEYDVSAAEAATDVAEFVALLETRGLIRSANENGADAWTK